MYIKFEDSDGLANCVCVFFLRDFGVNFKGGFRDVLSMVEPWPPEVATLKMLSLLGLSLGYFF